MNNNRREKESISSSATMMKKKKEDVCPRRAGIRTATTPITTQQDASRSGGVVRHEDEPGGGLVQPKNHLTKAAAAAPDIIMRQEQQQQQLLASPPVSKKVVEYVTKTNKDVLLGRGGETNLHPGNQHYLQEVKRFIADYESTPKRSKLNISQQVVDWIARRGGRFIKKEAGTGRWYVVPNEDARNKASQALREACKQQKQEVDQELLESISSEEHIFDDDGTILEGIDLTSHEGVAGRSQVQEQSSSADGTADEAQAMDIE